MDQKKVEERVKSLQAIPDDEFKTTLTNRIAAAEIASMAVQRALDAFNGMGGKRKDDDMQQALVMLLMPLLVESMEDICISLDICVGALMENNLLSREAVLQKVGYEQGRKILEAVDHHLDIVTWGLRMKGFMVEKAERPYPFQE